MSNNNFQLAKEWIKKSQNDFKSAEILHKESGPTDVLCFHCHQAVEKILKGFLVFNKIEFPKVHDLIYLLRLCEKANKNFGNLKEKISFLNRYYIESRYPPETEVYSKKECQQAIKFAEVIIQLVVNKVV